MNTLTTPHLALINQTIDNIFPPSDTPLHEATRHSLEGGKRIRPLLTLSVMETFDSPIEKALVPACTLELVHTYSLIHDDLPCMDDDDFRRGKPSLHKAFPESLALLTGDYLLTLAFELLTHAPKVSAEDKIALINTLSHLAGETGMIGGQILDLTATDLTLEQLEEMHLKKTGALITASLLFGGILSGADLPPLQSIGAQLGIAYQFIDDLIDGNGAVDIIGPKQTQEFAHTLYQNAHQEILALKPATPLLEQLAHDLIFRTA
ncbi:MAG: Farnesyl diphosphate synthase [Chlamydiae bacterium]|nr:Farnesyl diphosphate synthase [Chlamydiota bacterium]